MRVGHNWRYLSANDAYSQLVGIPKEELIGRLLWDVVPWVRRSRVGTALRRAMTSRAVSSANFRSRLKPGHYALMTMLPDDRDGVYVILRYSDKRPGSKAATVTA